MPTLRDTAQLLTAARDIAGAVEIVRLLGFEPPVIDLDEAARARLGIGDDPGRIALVRGPGALRALLVHRASGSAREAVSPLARALRMRTRRVLWFLVVVADEHRDVALACWAGDHSPPRVAALVARCDAVVASDAETLLALAGAVGGDDLLVHLRWHELLGRDALSRRFYRILEQRVGALAGSLQGVASAAERGELALLCVSRLLFLAFLETKGWLDGDPGFLVRHFDACMAAGGDFHARVLLPLFFGTLNTPMRRRAAAARRFGAVPFLNGGLFARTALETRHGRARFADAAFGELFTLLFGAFRFTARETAAALSESRIDPEMLGRAFESLMAQSERRRSGAYYTPHALVAHLADSALAATLESPALPRAAVEAALAEGRVDAAHYAALREALRTFTVMDPACGSGAFLVYLLERIAQLHRVSGDERDLAAIRRDVLARGIHGVDVNPTAVWLCELRLWLSVVIESGETRMGAVPPLPNIDCRVRIGDALAGEGFRSPPALMGTSAVLRRLQLGYARSTGARKRPLRQAIDREERRRALAALDGELRAIAAARNDRVLLLRSPDLFGQRRRASAAEQREVRALRRRAAELRAARARIAQGGALPFAFASHFATVHACGGFDLVVGNPPWVRLHNIPVAARAAFRQRFQVYRDAAWEPDPGGRHAPHGFAAQVDLAALFTERAQELARPGGTVALLLPAKLWRSLAGGGVRRLIGTRASLVHLEDWSDAPAAFDAAVYPSAVVLRNASRAAAPVTCRVRRRELDVHWTGEERALRLVRDDAGSPLLLLPPEARRAFDLLAERGTPLGRGPLGRPLLGVKCGCNDAFLLSPRGAAEGGTAVEWRGRRGVVEEELLRPLLRGEHVVPWTIPRARDAILWTHDSRGAPLTSLPGRASRWLAPWRHRLAARTDLRGGTRWWMLFRTEGADPRRPRVVWSDFGRRPRAALLAAGDPTVPLNSCYVLFANEETDALALIALLNSPLVAAWLNAVAEPARGGWRRYLAWTVAQLPLPADWPRARARLAHLAERALLGEPPPDAELLAAACRAYRVRQMDIAPLVAWCH